MNNRTWLVVILGTILLAGSFFLGQVSVAEGKVVCPDPHQIVEIDLGFDPGQIGNTFSPGIYPITTCVPSDTDGSDDFRHLVGPITSM